MTCKTNEAVALNIRQTKDFIEANGIATVKADKTGSAPNVDALLRSLGNANAGIPFYAVFPAGEPNKPILLDGILTPSRIIDALKRAGPSKNLEGESATAMR